MRTEPLPGSQLSADPGDQSAQDTLRAIWGYFPGQAQSWPERLILERSNYFLLLRLTQTEDVLRFWLRRS